MLKNKWIQQLLRVLISLLGAGLGAAITLGFVQIVHLANPTYTFSLCSLIVAYAGTSFFFLAIFYAMSNRILKAALQIFSAVDRSLQKLSLTQLISRIVGLIAGLVIACLLSQILHFMGNSLFTVISAAIIYVIFGTCGYTLGRIRSTEASQLMGPMHRVHRFHRKKGLRRHRSSRPVLLIDCSALIDGRITNICHLGFLLGEILIPDFVMNECLLISNAAEPVKQAKGKRGLLTIESLQKDVGAKVYTAAPSLEDNEVRLMRLAKKLHASIITCDSSLNKAARLSEINVMNLNELANTLRPSITTGEIMQISIVKEGKEHTQGIAYTPDGTMIVVEGGREYVGQSVQVAVTSVLQTNAGRMIFAKLLV